VIEVKKYLRTETKTKSPAREQEQKVDEMLYWFHGLTNYIISDLMRFAPKLAISIGHAKEQPLHPADLEKR